VSPRSVSMFAIARSRSGPGGRAWAEVCPALALDVPPARILSAPAGKPRVERRERTRTPAAQAETEFRRGVALLNQGRGPEAEEHFAAALEYDRSHRAARQALVVLALGRGQLESARRLLQEGLAVDPAQPAFAVTLARIYIERGQLPAALDVLKGSEAAAATNSDFHVLRGAVLQRLGRHGDAADAYRSALQLQAANPQAWIALGISLEALKQRAEAAEAFQRALAAGPVSAELKVYAEQRIRALR